MAESSNKHLSHKCCAAALCSNRSDNRKDLIFHAFPKYQILRKTWEIKMKRGNKKFASNRALYCCTLSRRTTERVWQAQGEILWKCRSFHFYMVRSKRGSESEVWEQESVGTKQPSHSRVLWIWKQRAHLVRLRQWLRPKIIPRKRIWTAKHKREI